MQHIWDAETMLHLLASRVVIHLFLNLKQAGAFLKRLCFSRGKPMNKDTEGETKGLMGEIADALGRRRGDDPITGHGGSRDFRSKRSKRKTLILSGAVMLLLIILFAPFYRRGRESSPEDLPLIQARLGQLEEAIARLEGMEDRIVYLDRQQIELQRYLAENDRYRGQLAHRLDTLTEKVDRLQKTMGTVTVETKAPPTSQGKPFPLAKGRYHEVRHGDTLYQIAQQCGTSVDELCRLNHINPEQAIYPGQKLLVTPERHQ
jgi:uncharacterized coiled-coil protein SlyX